MVWDGNEKIELQLLLRFSHTFGHLLLELRVGLSPLLGGVHVGRALVVGVGQHGDDGDQDGLHGVDRQPALARLLVTVPVISWLVKNRDANFAVLINIWVPNLGENLELWGLEGVLPREQKVTLEETAFVEGIRGTNYHHLPSEDVVVVDESGGEALHRVLVQL